VIAAKLPEAKAIIQWVSTEAQAQLESLDYEQYFAVAAFQGSNPYLRYRIEIKTVTRKENTVTIYAQFREPEPGREANPSETSPYHLIRIPKEGAWGRYITFNLSVNGSILVSLSHYVAYVPSGEETKLSSETIEQTKSSRYPGTDPQLQIITESTETRNVVSWISPKAEAQLKSLDYQQYFAIAVFQGRKPDYEYSVEIEAVSRKENTVTIYAQFHEPEPDRERRQMETSPYHLIRIPKEGAWGRYITFNLSVSGSVLVSLSHYVPSASSIAGQSSLQGEPSEAARAALMQIAEREGIPIAALTIIADHAIQFPILGWRFQVVTLLDNRPNGIAYKVLVDLTNNRIVEDEAALRRAEAEAYRHRYGKLEPALYERMQSLHEDDVLPVAIWMVARPGQTLAEQQQAAFATLAARYPEAAAAMARSGAPFDVDDRALAGRIYAEYLELMKVGAQARTQPLATELARRGFAVTTYADLPSVTSRLPKRVIEELSKREDVASIYLIEEKEQPALN